MQSQRIVLSVTDQMKDFVWVRYLYHLFRYGLLTFTDLHEEKLHSKCEDLSISDQRDHLLQDHGEDVVEGRTMCQVWPST